MRVYIRIVMIMMLESQTLPHQKNVVVKSVMFLHQNIHKYTWTSPDQRLTTRLITY